MIFTLPRPAFSLFKIQYLGIFIGILLQSIPTDAQKLSLSGKIQDSIGRPIAFTNIIATPQQEGQEIAFAISDEEGKYKLSLEREIPYALEINYMGFSPIADTVQIAQNSVRNFTLYESTTRLEEAVVQAKMAMIVREDTITYRTDKFASGNERKLREVLKKLPGVEVDKAGNVTVNGKKVDKLMVDGKDFFGGDTKLGVNNIPADAVEEVEAIDDYHEVAFMKGLSESDVLAMNIKLKEDKKHFVFGESQFGGGDEKRYYAKPTLFYYSPETTVNFIGSFNNINESPLDFNDVIRFQGGFGAFLDNPIQSGDEGLSQFSQSPNTEHNKTIFSAVNFTQKIGKDVHLEAYSIAAQQKRRFLTTTDIDYLTQEEVHEHRNKETEDKGFGSFNKIRLRYQPEIAKDLAYDFVANVSNASKNDFLDSRLGDSTSFINALAAPHNLKISQFLRYNTQPVYEHTSEIKANYTYKKTNQPTHWDFDRPIFSGIIPIIQDSDQLNLIHDYTTQTHTGRADYKHYWVLNNTNHIYPKAGIYYFDQSYGSTDYQLLENGNRNSFREAGFDNDLRYRLIDPYIGFQYKFMLGKKLIMRPGIFYHHYYWNADQFGQRIAHHNKGLFLPEFHAEYKLSGFSKIELDYHLKANFAEASSYANRLRLTNYNALYRGNADLENALYHDLTLSYRDFNMAHGLNYNFNFSYNRKEKSISRSTEISGIDQIGTSIYTDVPENSYNFSVGVGKNFGGIRTRFMGSAVLSDYARTINGQRLNYNTDTYLYALSARSNFKKWPNLSLGITQSFRNSRSKQVNNRYYALSPNAELEYDFLEDFTFKFNYDYHYTKDNSSAHGQEFQIGNTSLYYHKTDSPWGFEIRVDNLFNARFKRAHSLSEFQIYDQQIFIQPRTALFILSYHL